MRANNTIEINENLKAMVKLDPTLIKKDFR